MLFGCWICAYSLLLVKLCCFDWLIRFQDLRVYTYSGESVFFCFVIYQLLCWMSKDFYTLLVCLHAFAVFSYETYLQRLFLCNVHYVNNIVKYIIKCIFINYSDIFVSAHWCPSYFSFPIWVHTCFNICDRCWMKNLYSQSNTHTGAALAHLAL